MTRKHKRWSRWCVMLVWAAVVGTSHGRADDAAPQAREQELVAVLRSETPEAEKALAFKGLAVHGSPACVEAVAAYLGNERLASWARITLEVIPGDAASAALRAAPEPEARLLLARQENLRRESFS